MSDQEVKTPVETTETTEETPVETPVENKSLESRIEELENKLSKLVDILNSCYLERSPDNFRWYGGNMSHKKSEMESL